MAVKKISREFDEWEMIGTKTDNEAALTCIKEPPDAAPDSPEEEELASLAIQIEMYEKDNFSIDIH
ncbi:MAG: hypothetical protein WC959_10910 [Kiritimatiellales bacterium]